MNKKQLPLPEPERVVTVVAICSGESYVGSAKVIVSKENFIALEPENPQHLTKLLDAVTTVMYTVGDMGYVIKGKTRPEPLGKSAVLEPDGPPRLGERREFIRAQLELDYAAFPGEDIKSLEELRQWADSFKGNESPHLYKTAKIDLSGSGARFPFESALKKGSFLVFSIRCPKGHACNYLHLPSRVVRTKQANEHVEVAVEFVMLTQEERDALVNMVFEARFRALGVTPDSW